MAGIPKNIPRIHIVPDCCWERFLPLSEDFAHPLRARGVVLSGVSELYRGYEISRPAKDFHHLIFTTAGEGRYITRESEGVLRAGDLWIVPGPAAERFWVEERWNMFWFHLDDIEQWAHLRAHPVQVRHFVCPHPLQALMEQYVSECVSEKPEKATAARAYADIIGVLLERELTEEEDPVSRRIRNALALLWEEVNAKINQPWDVRTLAARLHLSTMQLYRQVARYQGTRPMEMVARLRMLRAKDLLRNTDCTLDKIAQDVGYETSFALSRAFKKIVGVSPREYRRLHKLDR
jgi:AraC family transcriptional regulator